MNGCLKMFNNEDHELKKQYVISRLQSWATYRRNAARTTPPLHVKTSSIGQMAAESVSAKRNNIGLIKYRVWYCRDCNALHTNTKPTHCKKCGGDRFKTNLVDSITGKRVYASMIHDTGHEQNYLIDMQTDTAIDMMDPLLRAVIFANYLNENSTQEEKAEDLEIGLTTYKHLLSRAHDYLIGYFDAN